ncbi:cyclic pyranopterin monophosphate synthase MoaC [Candidatus Aerophobetes bacterium]|nr:cyclic pyranopterin monophosphate synthase MoaC [Candidatus Aerophobetes bacterium]
MIDVGEKPIAKREAKAQGKVSMSASTIALIRENKIPKGDVLENARTAAILALKKVPHLIPLCHPIKITWAKVDFNLTESVILIESVVKGVDRTGVEMEAITAVAVAALTIYDMCKAVDKSIVIGDIRVVEKKKEEVI